MVLHTLDAIGLLSLTVCIGERACTPVPFTDTRSQSNRNYKQNPTQSTRTRKKKKEIGAQKSRFRSTSTHEVRPHRTNKFSQIFLHIATVLAMQVNFNERASVVATSSHAGFQLYSVPPSQGFRHLHTVTHLAGASMVAILDETPLVAMVGSSVGQGTDRMLQVYDTSTKEVLSSLLFDSSILNVRMNPKRLVVIRERQTHIFDLNTMAPQTQFATTSPPNRLGLGALSPLTDGGTCFYCYPFTSRHKWASSRGEGQGSSQGGDEIGGAALSSCPGDVAVLEAVSNNDLQPFRAHDHPLVALAICGDGSKVVTASTSGTIIRVFNLQGLLLHQFRRGQRRARITDLSVSFFGMIVSVCSDSGTLHLFRCEPQSERFSMLVARDVKSFAKLALRPNSKTRCAINMDGSCLSVASVPIDGASGSIRGSLHQYAIEQKDIRDLGVDNAIGHLP